LCNKEGCRTYKGLEVHFRLYNKINCSLPIEKTKKRDLQEALCDSLPEVPNDINEEIESKLLKLKFFNQVWLSDNKTEKTCIGNTNKIPESPGKEVTNDESKMKVVKGNIATANTSNDVPVYSTPDDKKEFNTWYHEEISKMSPKVKQQKAVKDLDDIPLSVYTTVDQKVGIQTRFWD